MSTGYGFNGQYSYASDFGLLYFNARWVDPVLGRFAQADTIVPAGVQGYDRYAFVNNNPVRYTDPSGHWFETALDVAFIAYDIYDISANGLNWENGLSLAADVVGAVLPVVTGGGMAVRAIMHADDAVDAIKIADKVIDAGNATDNLADLGKVIGDICSFSADTQVATKEGSENISAIEIGDYVLAWNEADDTLGFYEVTDTFSHADEVITRLVIDGEWIETTPEHPFYTEEEGWLPADKLKPGMHIRQAGRDYELVWLKWNVHKTQEMYNLTVDEAHTYFVGDGQWLVHNDCVKSFEVGMTDDLLGRSPTGDNLQIHHAPQKIPASEVIPGYDASRAPGIVLPDGMHYEVNKFNLKRGVFTGTMSELFDKTLNDLAAVGVPEESLSELHELILNTYQR